MKELIIQIRTIGFSSNEIVTFLETDSQLKHEVVVMAVTGQTIHLKSKVHEKTLVGKIEDKFPGLDITAGEPNHTK